MNAESKKLVAKIAKLKKLPLTVAEDYMIEVAHGRILALAKYGKASAKPKVKAKSKAKPKVKRNPNLDREIAKAKRQAAKRSESAQPTLQ